MSLAIADCTVGDSVLLDNDGRPRWYRITSRIGSACLVRLRGPDGTADVADGPWAVPNATPVLLREKSHPAPAKRGQAASYDPLRGEDPGSPDGDLFGGGDGGAP